MEWHWWKQMWLNVEEKVSPESTSGLWTWTLKPCMRLEHFYEIKRSNTGVADLCSRFLDDSNTAMFSNQSIHCRVYDSKDDTLFKRQTQALAPPKYDGNQHSSGYIKIKNLNQGLKSIYSWCSLFNEQQLRTNTSVTCHSYTACTVRNDYRQSFYSTKFFKAFL